MTTPNSNTPNGIIFDAMQDAALLQDGESPTSEQYAKYSRRLLDMIRLWQTQGLKLWLNQDIPVPLTADQAEYTFYPGGDVDMAKPMRVIQGYYLVDDNRRPLTPLSWNDYLTLSQVTQPGAINSYFVNMQQTQMSVFFWETPDATEAANGVGHVLLQAQVTTFTNLTETINFPDEWRIALRWGLADEISTGQPQAIMDRCSARATTFRTMLEDWDVEQAPTQFTPDTRSAYTGSSFR